MMSMPSLQRSSSQYQIPERNTPIIHHSSQLPNILAHAVFTIIRLVKLRLFNVEFLHGTIATITQAICEEFGQAKAAF